MPGFFFGNMGAATLDNVRNEGCVCESRQSGGLHYARNTPARFMADKASYEDDRFIIMAEGALLNKGELFAEYAVDAMPQLIINAYLRRGDTFFADFRGPFSGALYEKRTRRWIAYTSHCGDNSVFYYADGAGRFCFGSQVNYILEALRENSIPLTVNEAAVYAMLTYAFMVDDATYAQEVKRLLPGCYAVIEHGKVSIRDYYRPKSQLIDISDLNHEQVVEEMDRRFRQAVEREFSKDEEYGVQHLCDLSGGLDSRMTNWVAHDMGYENCLNITFSQSGYTDEVVSEQIAEALGNNLLFRPSENIHYLLNPERIISMNYGLGLYSGIGPGESLLSDLNIGKYGIEHTGQVGDVVIGTFIQHGETAASEGHGGAYSARLLDRVPVPCMDDYRDREEFLMFRRGFLGALSTHIIRRNYTEVASPFLDVDLLDFCMSIPANDREAHHLYKEWIIGKYPDAAQFIWEKEGIPVASTSLQRVGQKVRGGVRYLLTRVAPALTARSKRQMGPAEYWYHTKPDLRRRLDAIFDKYLEAATCSEELKGDLLSFFATGSVIEKTQAITAVVALRYYAGYGAAGWELMH